MRESKMKERGVHLIVINTVAIRDPVSELAMHSHLCFPSSYSNALISILTELLK